MRVRVLKKDVERAKKLYKQEMLDLCCCCPLALALKRKTHKKCAVMPYGYDQCVWIGNVKKKMTIEAVLSARLFDKDMILEPGWYTVCEED